MGAPFDFDRTWRFDVPPETLWAAVTATERFPRVWPWLRDEHLGPVAEGTVARFRVASPLPYRLRLTVRVDRVVPGARVDVTVGGDVTGPARLEVAADGDGSIARLAWSLQVQRRSLQLLEGVARPLMSWGHNTVVASGLDRFRTELHTHADIRILGPHAEGRDHRGVGVRRRRAAAPVRRPPRAGGGVGDG